MPKLALDYKAILAEQLHRFCGFRSELPERHRALIDVRRFGPGERFVFEPYTQKMCGTKIKRVMSGASMIISGSAQAVTSSRNGC